MDDVIEELMYSLLQGSDHVRKQAVYHPPLQKDLTNVFNYNGGIKQ